MPRHADPLQRHAGPAPDFDADDGEGDRDTEAAGQDVGQQRVARVVVVAGVAGEPLLDEEAMQQAVQVGDACRQPVELRQPVLDVERGIGARGHGQGGPVQRRVRLPDQLGEPLRGIHPHILGPARR